MAARICTRDDLHPGGIVAVRLAGDQLEPAWSQSAATKPPIIAGPGLWAVGSQTLFQLDRRTGRVRFSAPIGDPAYFATPAASGGRIIVAAGGHVYAFGQPEGEIAAVRARVQASAGKLVPPLRQPP